MRLKINLSMLIVLTYSLITLWMICYDAKVALLPWGNWIMFHYRDAYPVITVLVMGFLLIGSLRENKISKLEQLNKDSEETIEYHKQEKENSLKQLELARSLAKKQGNEELTCLLNTVINEYGNKLTLTELKYPELSALLINTVTEAKNYTRFEIEIEKDIEQLKYIPADDVVNLFKYLTDQITESQEDIEYDKRVVSLLVREGYKQEGMVFEFVHAAPFSTAKNESNLNTTALHWFKAKQIVHKYKGVLQTINHDEYTTVIKVFLPYQMQHKRIGKENSGS